MRNRWIVLPNKFGTFDRHRMAEGLGRRPNLNREPRFGVHVAVSVCAIPIAPCNRNIRPPYWLEKFASARALGGAFQLEVLGSCAAHANQAFHPFEAEKLVPDLSAK